MNPTVPDTNRLSGLVFELSSQLHAERMHRIALEAALMRAGVLTPSALERMAEDEAVRASSRRAVEESVARLMRVLTETQDGG